MLTSEETAQLIALLRKATPDRSEVTGKYDVFVTPVIYAPEKFRPVQRVCIGTILDIVGEAKL